MAALLLSVAINASTVNYTADNETIFPNPERGFITEFIQTVTPEEPYCIKGREDELQQYYIDRDQISLILVLYYLDNYKNTSKLPDELFTAFDEDMQILRNMGMKAILRFAYTQDYNDGTIGYDAPLDIVKSHIDQLRSHWQENADVIFVFQAGFVGAWGEWYFTSNFGNMQSTINESRAALLDYMLEAVPANRCIQLRTPLFKTGYIGDTNPLTKEEAYKNTARARLAHHNDAVLENDNNLGTYSDPETQKPYIAQETFFVPIGGESCILDEEVAAVNASYDATIAELSTLHWTFIQAGYSEVVTGPWRENGTFDELNRRLGYRYQLISGTYSDEVEQGGKLSVDMTIKNVGFAPLYNERPAYIVLKSEDKEYRLQLDSDPRSWLPNGEISSVSEQITLPAGIEEGTYELFLYLPDASDKLADDPRFAVRFANSEVWDAETGMNSLNASVTIKEKQVIPDPEPEPEPGAPIVLPGTLSKANVSAYCEEMTWYAEDEDYFDFGPDDAQNLDRWAEWNVELRYPGKYIVSEFMASAYAEWGLIGHNWQLQLLNNSEPVSTYATKPVWKEGNISYDEKWDLSTVAAATYTLRVQNATEYAQPKLRSLTLAYEGALPTENMQNIINSNDDTLHDVLGRKVDKNYKGIVISNGRKWLQQ